MTIAYVGPGAGFALLSSFFVLFTTIAIILLSIVALPVRILRRWLTVTASTRPSIDRLIVVGFDGQDPALTGELMREGRLPNFSKLAEAGCYHPLRTTLPAVSPVAWSSFSTGCGPGRHGIFDFIEPDRRTYLPRLSSARVQGPRRFFTVGRFRIPRERPEIRLLRKSKPFWSILGEHRIWSTILRVPVTFPPDRFYGAQLSAMSTPDLLGSQGTFLWFTSRTADARAVENGLRIAVPATSDQFETTVPGPAHPFLKGQQPMRVRVALSVDRVRRRVRVDIDGTRVDLEVGRLSDWVKIRFHAAPGVNVHGLTRLVVTEIEDHFSMYMAPLNLDPEHPAMPISHPPYFASYLAKRIGPYATLGLAEDTSALNEQAIDDEQFLEATYDIDRERERMLFDSLTRVRKGSVVCVFDATDRIQHMFWRDRGQTGAGPGPDPIRALYTRNDTIVGRLLAATGRNDVLMVISDHGFNAFRRGINLNAWLLREGYLALKPGADAGAEWLRDVDWPATRAYCLGLTGLFLNVRGRERDGTIAPGEEAGRLKSELKSRLDGLRDPEIGDIGIREAFDTALVYTGPYVENAPDLLIGYNAGYRVSWDSAKGIVGGPVFSNNDRRWSGDHCIDPRLVPGVFFCNRPIASADPALIDIAPTALKLFGITPPKYMDGRVLEGLA